MYSAWKSDSQKQKLKQQNKAVMRTQFAITCICVRPYSFAGSTLADLVEGAAPAS